VERGLLTEETRRAMGKSPAIGFEKYKKGGARLGVKGGKQKENRRIGSRKRKTALWEQKEHW